MVPVIICGGVGTKMWPESRQNSPKHFLPLFNGKSLFELNWEALRLKFKPEEIYLQTNSIQAKLAKKLVPEIVKKNIFVEPETRNQGPATGFTAAMLYKIHPDEPFMLIQADVLRQPAERFIEMIDVCDRLVRETNKYITGGFKPNYPVMGVDYLVPGERVSKKEEVGVFKVSQFLWRGTREQAEEYVNNKGALIHANHSCTTPRALLEMFKQYKPEWYTPLINIINGEDMATEYAKMPPGPIEDVTQEVHKAGNSLIVELPFDWTDVGTWESLMKYTAPKDHKNGHTIEIEAENNFVRVPKGKQVALVGVSDLIIVDTKDALLISHKNHTGSVGKIVDTLKNQGKHELL